MEVEAETLICESHERKFPSCNIHDHFNETSAYAKERGLVSSAYTVLQTEVFLKRDEKHLIDEKKKNKKTLYNNALENMGSKI